MGLYNETLNQNIDNLQVNSKLGNSGGGGGSLYNYIEEEHIVGTWIDGKQVYELVYTFSADNDLQWHNFRLGNVNIISFEPIGEFIACNTETTTYMRCYDVRANGFGVKIGSGFPAIVNGKVIIRYTKNA